MTPKLRHMALIITTYAAVSGCAHRQATDAAMRPQLTQAPAEADVLRALARNAAAMRDFDASGIFGVDAPELEGERRFRARIAFRKPADLSIIARDRLSGVVGFRLVSLGKEFFIEFPTEGRCYYQFDGEAAPDLPFSVSPSDVVREMFFSEPWDRLKRRDIEIVDYNPRLSAATVRVGNEGATSRMLELSGPEWLIQKNTLMDAGKVVAITTLGEYEMIDDVWFPTITRVEFPGADSSMTFEINKPRINSNPSGELFTIDREAALACRNESL